MDPTSRADDECREREDTIQRTARPGPARVRARTEWDDGEGI